MYMCMYVDVCVCLYMYKLKCIGTYICVKESVSFAHIYSSRCQVMHWNHSCLSMVSPGRFTHPGSVRWQHVYHITPFHFISGMLFTLCTFDPKSFKIFSTQFFHLPFGVTILLVPSITKTYILFFNLFSHILPKCLSHFSTPTATLTTALFSLPHLSLTFSWLNQTISHNISSSSISFPNHPPCSTHSYP